MSKPRLTNRQIDVLRELAESSTMLGPWLRPMDIGARDASHHSATLKRLAAIGLVERRPRNTLINVFGVGVRGSYVYRITTRGRAVLAPRLPKIIPAPVTPEDR